MKTLVLVRHGQSEANVAHVLSSDRDRNPLTAFGVSQVEETSEELRALQKVDGFFTSPVLRAGQTAGIIAKVLGKAPKVDERLKERGFGNFNNKGFESGEEMGDTFIKEVKLGYRNGVETWDSLKSRVNNFIQDLPDGTVTVAVSHRDLIAAALGLIDSSYDDDTIRSEELIIPTASITVLKPDEKKIMVIGSYKLPLL